MIFNTFNFNTCYISCACNPSPHCVDWNGNGLICYGSSNAVVIYKRNDNTGGHIIQTLFGHKARVNSVKWVKNDVALKNEIISGSSDNRVAIWAKNNQGNYELSTFLLGHTNAVTVVDALYRNLDSNLQLLVVTASVDSTVKVWSRLNSDPVVCLQTLHLANNGICLSIALTTFGKSNDVLIALGYDDSKVTLYTAQNNEFIKQNVLTGHEDWVRSLDFTLNDDDEVMLASASQDCTVRLWRFMTTVNVAENELQQEKVDILIGGKKFDIVLDGVLAGHEGWIYAAYWHPPLFSDDGVRTQPMQLVTVSVDKTFAVWAPEEETGVWLEVARMGEIGGNSIGFYGACYGPEGKSLLVHGYNGGMLIWNKKENLWEPGLSITGHFGGVVDLTWEAEQGRYLLSVSLDQTTRLHAPWLQNKGTWHEIARPQIHGYDMACIAALPNYGFVSGAEEKVIRVFKAPKNFLENFERLCCTKTEGYQQSSVLDNALGAAVPALGLSNQAIYTTQKEESAPADDRLSREQYSEAYFVPQDLTAPPTEDNLSQNTLWPEVMKLYGHGYEVYSLAATHNGKYVASACRATNVEHASIILWETNKWQKMQTLTCHQLTVTQLAFSPNDEHLLAVSRDRSWSLYKKMENSTEVQSGYALIAKSDKKTGIHTRIIWCCAWSHDCKYYTTGSRDGKLVAWSTEKQQSCAVLDIPGASVTSVAFAHQLLKQDEYLVAIGLESGEISLYGFTPGVEDSWKFCLKIDGMYGHTLTVKRLAFRPQKHNHAESAHEESQTSVFQLASCGLDHIIKIHDVILPCNKS